MPERLLGRTLGRYRLTRHLGTGAFAWVYEALDTELEIPVACKVLRTDRAWDADARTRVRREATTAARLRHPNVVNVRDIGVAEDELTFIVMDLHPGSVGRLLAERGALPALEVARTGVDVAAALATAHAHGIVHRDIKPDNILLAADGRAVVADFGLARALSDEAGPGGDRQIVGTPHYSAPEQALGHAVDGRTDLYALGVTMYRALAGRLPFAGRDGDDVLRQHAACEAPRLPATGDPLADGLADVVHRCLAKDPAERHPDATALRRALLALPGVLTPERQVSLPTASGEWRAAPPAAGLDASTAPLSAILSPASGAATMATSGRERSRSADGDVRRGPGLLVSVMTVLVMAAMVSGLDAMRAAARAVGASESRPTATEIGLAGDTVVADLTAPIGDTLSADSVPRFEVTRPARLEVAADDSARVRVGTDTARLAPFALDGLTPRPVVVTAWLDGLGTAECDAARRTDTVRLAAGRTTTYAPLLSRCATVTLDIDRLDARVRLLDDGGRVRVAARADSLGAVIVPAGEWRVEADRPGCSHYSAAYELAPGPERIRIRMIC